MSAPHTQATMSSPDTPAAMPTTYNGICGTLTVRSLDEKFYKTLSRYLPPPTVEAGPASAPVSAPAAKKRDSAHASPDTDSNATIHADLSDSTIYEGLEKPGIECREEVVDDGKGISVPKFFIKLSGLRREVGDSTDADAEDGNKENELAKARTGKRGMVEDDEDEEVGAPSNRSEVLAKARAGKRSMVESQDEEAVRSLSRKEEAARDRAWRRRMIEDEEEEILAELSRWKKAKSTAEPQPSPVISLYSRPQTKTAPTRRAPAQRALTQRAPVQRAPPAQRVPRAPPRPTLPLRSPPQTAPRRRPGKRAGTRSTTILPSETEPALHPYIRFNEIPYFLNPLQLPLPLPLPQSTGPQREGPRAAWKRLYPNEAPLSDFVGPNGERWQEKMRFKSDVVDIDGMMGGYVAVVLGERYEPRVLWRVGTQCRMAREAREKERGEELWGKVGEAGCEAVEEVDAVRILMAMRT